MLYSSLIAYSQHVSPPSRCACPHSHQYPALRDTFQSPEPHPPCPCPAVPRDPCAAPASPHRRQASPADPDGLTRLIQLFEQQQLVALLSTATLHALATAKAACSASPAPAAAPAPHAASKLTRAVLLPHLRLLSTLAMCSRALVSHAHVQELRFRSSRGRQQLQQQLHGGGVCHCRWCSTGVSFGCWDVAGRQQFVARFEEQARGRMLAV